MKRNGKKMLLRGGFLLAAFVLWTIMIMIIDVKPTGVNGSNIGFAALNHAFHDLTGVHMALYTITDWLGILPFAAAFVFAIIGLVQLIKRKGFIKVDSDILLLGGFYIIVVFCYLLFEEVVINYRPILIEGMMEASYPSSTTLLVLSIMLTTVFQVNRRVKKDNVRKIINILCYAFMIFMVLGRTVSGVHWLTDIIGSVIFSFGVFYIYKGLVFWTCLRKRQKKEAE